MEADLGSGLLQDSDELIIVERRHERREEENVIQRGIRGRGGGIPVEDLNENLI